MLLQVILQVRSTLRQFVLSFAISGTIILVNVSNCAVDTRKYWWKRPGSPCSSRIRRLYSWSSCRLHNIVYPIPSFTSPFIQLWASFYLRVFSFFCYAQIPSSGCHCDHVIIVVRHRGCLLSSAFNFYRHRYEGADRHIISSAYTRI